MEHGYRNSVINLDELLYLVYFGIMFGARVVGLYEGQPVYNAALVVGLLVWGIKIVVTEHTTCELCMIFGIIGLCFLIYYNTGEKGILLYMTMLLGMKNVGIRKVFHMAVCLLGSAFFTLVIASSLKIIPDILFFSNRLGFGEVIRHSLGYPYPNTLMTVYIVLMALLMITLGKQDKKQLAIISICLWLGVFYLFLYSCSNTGLLVSTVYLILNYYFQTRTSISKLERSVIYFLYPFLVGFVTIAFPLLSHRNETVFQLSDRLFHNRIFLSYYYLTEEKWTLFGSRMAEKYLGDYRYMIDNSFLYSFIQLGIVMGIMLSVMNMYLVYKFVKEDRRIELAILISFWILGLSDPFLYNLAYKNILFLYAGEELYKWLQTTKWNQNRQQWTILPLRKMEMRIPKFVQQIEGFYRKIKEMILDLEWRDVIIFLVICAVVWYAQLHNIGKIEEISNIDKWEKIRYAMTISCLVGSAGAVISKRIRKCYNNRKKQF